MATSSKAKITEILLETERVGDRVLALKQELINLDKRRQETREAIRTVQKNFPDRDGQKVWITVGSMLMKMPRPSALELLAKDAAQIEAEIGTLRTEQKVLVSRQRDLEHDTPLRGFDLKPLSRAELTAIGAAVPRV
uniref:p53 and DNA damage-regulated protein 1 n=1 Tax=Culex tarsalis TaxID=7177 RepID=A0A1Q3F6A5_CULTA